jgi:hypothetical protein
MTLETRCCLPRSPGNTRATGITNSNTTISKNRRANIWRAGLDEAARGELEIGRGFLGRSKKYQRKPRPPPFPRVQFTGNAKVRGHPRPIEVASVQAHGVASSRAIEQAGGGTGRAHRAFVMLPWPMPSASSSTRPHRELRSIGLVLTMCAGALPRSGGPTFERTCSRSRTHTMP